MDLKIITYSASCIVIIITVLICILILIRELRKIPLEEQTVIVKNVKELMQIIPINRIMSGILEIVKAWKGKS